MGNHVHLLLETPEPNLTTGMKWLLGTFSQGWNARRARRGHVFQGRYKSIPVSAATESPYYFRIVADYIHLNPARAGLAGGRHGKLVSYKWSSLRIYSGDSGPDWLVLERVLNAFELAKDGRGRRAYVAWLEKRAEDPTGDVNEEAMKALRRGWYLGEPTFADKLRALVAPGEMSKAGRDRVALGHGEAEAESLVKKATELLEIPSNRTDLLAMRKGDTRKVIVAVLLRKRTSVGNRWIADRLAMGHTGALSRLLGTFRKSPANMESLDELEKMLR